MINTIGPLWDGNEVWLITAGGTMFAAFPGWYASLFSGLYLPLFLVLVGLILRGVAFEYRAKRDDLRWKAAFDWCATIGSFLPAGLRHRLRELREGHQGRLRRAGRRNSGACSAPSACSGASCSSSSSSPTGAVFIALKTRRDVQHNAALRDSTKAQLAQLP